jgi:hypothetical protein
MGTTYLKENLDNGVPWIPLLVSALYWLGKGTRATAWPGRNTTEMWAIAPAGCYTMRWDKPLLLCSSCRATPSGISWPGPLPLLLLLSDTLATRPYGAAPLEREQLKP